MGWYLRTQEKSIEARGRATKSAKQHLPGRLRRQISSHFQPEPLCERFSSISYRLRRSGSTSIQESAFDRHASMLLDPWRNYSGSKKKRNTARGSSTCLLPSTPMGAGVGRSSASSTNHLSTACVQGGGRQPVAQSGEPLQSGSSCSSRSNQ